MGVLKHWNGTKKVGTLMGGGGGGGNSVIFSNPIDTIIMIFYIGFIFEASLQWKIFSGKI